MTGIIPTLDSTAVIAKSDTLISSKCRRSLVRAFRKLRADEAGCLDWHPGTDGKVLNLVHPSMFPLVYGRSRGFRQEVVGVQDVIDPLISGGDVIESPAEPSKGEDNPITFWSTKYQWLPSNFEISGDGSVHIISYINNLHPSKYAPIYKMIEKLVAKALPLWDQCLYRVDSGIAIGAGRHTSRFAPPIDAE